MENAQLQELSDFLSRDKFSQGRWAALGLHASGDEVSKKLNDLFNATTEEVITAVKNQRPLSDIGSILKNGLTRFNKKEYDTEEREFICDLFLELSAIVGVDSKKQLNIWLYGPVISKIVSITQLTNKIFKPETLIQPCSQCSIELLTYIKKRDASIPETTWLIGKCNACDELNIIKTGPGIKELEFGNYQWVESLLMSDYKIEDAIKRLEQIKQVGN